MTDTLPEVADPPRYYRLVLFRLGRPWLSANDRLHWNTRARITRMWRSTASWQARGLPKMDGAHIVCELRLHGRYRRDAGNWAPTAKAVVDGLVDAQVLPDDNDDTITGPDLRRGPKAAVVGDEQLIVHLWPTGLRL